MTIHKLKSIKILGVDTDEYVGSAGTIFYDDETGILRLSDGTTLGGIDVTTNIDSNNLTTIDGGTASTQF
jgi:hypothetical protein